MLSQTAEYALRAMVHLAQNPGEARTVDERCVIQSIADDEVAGGGERREGADVRGVAAREGERFFGPEPGREGSLEAAMLVPLSRDQA